MDPKSSAPLDPKLQEAYNKVMGTQVPATTPPADTTSLATPPQTMPSMPTAPTAMPTDTSMSSMSSAPLPTPTEPTMPASTETVSVGNAPTISYDNVTPAQGFSADKKKMKISPIILVIGGIVFLVVYSLVWIKVFNLQVPYINP